MHLAFSKLKISTTLFNFYQQVHNSVQMGIQLAGAKESKLITHANNHIKAIKAKIEKLQHQYRRIWYFCNGIYSIYGYCAPLSELENLRNKYENLHIYIDDVHDISWTGQNQGEFTLEKLIT